MHCLVIQDIDTLDRTLSQLRTFSYCSLVLSTMV